MHWKEHKLEGFTGDHKLQQMCFSHPTPNETSLQIKSMEATANTQHIFNTRYQQQVRHRHNKVKLIFLYFFNFVF